jgi:tRNA-splicing endonuclease subunit Sen54
MADATEETIQPPPPTEAPDLTEEVQDFSFLLTAAQAGKIPNRGTKDFEYDGTRLQERNLESAREAMRIVLSQGRSHTAKNVVTGVWDGGFKNGEARGNGVWVLNPKGVWAKSLGVSRRVEREDVVKVGSGDSEEALEVEEDEEDDSELATKTAGEEATDSPSQPIQKIPRLSRLWLLPEEALFLLERGSLDIRWPAENGQPEFEGLPMSLQGAYATFIGMSPKNGLTLEQYKVYQTLKRSGYIVLRAKDNFQNVPQPLFNNGTGLSFQWTFFRQLWGNLFNSKTPDLSMRAKTGPLVPRGLYRNYDDIYKALLLIPFHSPKSNQDVSPPSSSPDALSITYHVYKSTPSYKKTSPGPPDYYICVMDAWKTSLPTEPQLDALLRQTPYHQPNEKDGLTRKLKTGYRNVLLAIVDSGVVSFLNVNDAGFGCEKLWGRGVRAPRGGGKGGRGRGRGRGRGAPGRGRGG